MVLNVGSLASLTTIMKIYIQEWMQTTGGKCGKVTGLAPTIVQMIRKQGVSEKACVSVVDIINNGDLTNKEYIMMPVNNNDDLEKDAESHWSLLIYRKTDSKFYHYDSIRGVNKIHAKKVIEIGQMQTLVSKMN